MTDDDTTPIAHIVTIGHDTLIVDERVARHIRNRTTRLERSRALQIVRDYRALLLHHARTADRPDLLEFAARVCDELESKIGRDK